MRVIWYRRTHIRHPPYHNENEREFHCIDILCSHTHIPTQNTVMEIPLHIHRKISYKSNDDYSIVSRQKFHQTDFVGFDGQRSVKLREKKKI